MRNGWQQTQVEIANVLDDHSADYLARNLLGRVIAVECRCGATLVGGRAFSEHQRDAIWAILR